MSVETVKKFKRKLDGLVVSATNEKTIIVNVSRRYKHGTYSKFITSSKKYHAHDEKNVAKVGDRVEIIESRPYSKLKNWELVNVQS
jgi:small subunit ribosomal protein S17